MKKRNPIASILRLFKPKKTKKKNKYNRKEKHKSILACLVLFTILVSGCSSTPTIKTITEYKMPDIIHPADPQPLILEDFNLLVVNKEILTGLANDADDKTVYMMVPPEDYSIIVKNMNALKDYILQQMSIIEYYRKILTPEKEEKK